MSGETIFIEGGGIRMHVRLDGPKHAEPLMLSNSLGSTLEMWDPQIAVLSQTHRVIRYDVRGHGETSATKGPYTLALLAGDALRVLDTLGIHKADWAGCSLGGMLGQWMLTHHRDRIGKAVLGNTAAFMGPPSTDWNARIRMAHHKGMGQIAEAMKLRWFTRRFNDKNPAEVARVTDQIKRSDPAGYSGCCAAIRDMDQRETIKSITNPVLVVIGAEDPATPPASGELIVRHIAGAKSVVLAAAHISNCEVPADYNKAVSAFLNG